MINENQRANLGHAADATDGAVHDVAIGSILRDLRSLSADQVEKVLVHQREKSLRFGEAAVALGFVSSDDVMYALSQQFHYPYAPDDQRKLHSDVVVLNRPFSPQAESFRGFRSQLSARVNGGPELSVRRALCVVSPLSGDGRSYFAANIAASFAQLGSRTLLLDADMRRPRQHELFMLGQRTVGLSSILSGRAESQVIHQVPGVPSLFVMPVGVVPPNPLELVERPAFGLLIRELLGKFDHVIVDTPAAVHGSDCSVIAARCGAAMVIARRNKSRVRDMEDLIGTIADGPAQVVGAVLNEF